MGIFNCSDYSFSVGVCAGVRKNELWRNSLDWYRQFYTATVRACKIWFCYFVYRYLIRSAGELDFEAVIKSAIISYFLISRIGEDQKFSMQLYSKETEHNKRNIDRLFSFSKKIKF